MGEFRQRSPNRGDPIKSVRNNPRRSYFSWRRQTGRRVDRESGLRFAPPPGEVGQQSFTGQCIHICLHAALVFIRQRARVLPELGARLRNRRRLALGRGLRAAPLSLSVTRDEVGLERSSKRSCCLVRGEWVSLCVCRN